MATDHREGGVGGDNTGQVRRATRAGDHHADVVGVRVAGERRHVVRGAVRAHDVQLIRNAQLIEGDGSVFHDR
jgi:hypothetical protein